MFHEAESLGGMKPPWAQAEERTARTKNDFIASTALRLNFSFLLPKNQQAAMSYLRRLGIRCGGKKKKREEGKKKKLANTIECCVHTPKLLLCI